MDIWSDRTTTARHNARFDSQPSIDDRERYAVAAENNDEEMIGCIRNDGDWRELDRVRRLAEEMARYEAEGDDDDES